MKSGPLVRKRRNFVLFVKGAPIGQSKRSHNVVGEKPRRLRGGGGVFCEEREVFGNPSEKTG